MDAVTAAAMSAATAMTARAVADNMEKARCNQIQSCKMQRCKAGWYAVCLCHCLCLSGAPLHLAAVQGTQEKAKGVEGR